MHLCPLEMITMMIAWIQQFIQTKLKGLQIMTREIVAIICDKLYVLEFEIITTVIGVVYFCPIQNSKVNK